MFARAPPTTKSDCYRLGGRGTLAGALRAGRGTLTGARAGRGTLGPAGIGINSCGAGVAGDDSGCIATLGAGNMPTLPPC